MRQEVLSILNKEFVLSRCSRIRGVASGERGCISISFSCQTWVFSQEGCILLHEVFFKMNLPLALDVYNKMFIDSLGFVVVDKSRKYLLGLTHSKKLTLALISDLTL